MMRYENGIRDGRLLSVCAMIIAVVVGGATALDLPIPTGGYDADWAKTFTVNVKHAGKGYSANDVVSANMIVSTVPANILWPGEKGAFTVQLVNNSDKPVEAEAILRTVRYELYTLTGPGKDMFHVAPRKLADAGEQKIKVSLAAKGYQNLELKPEIPETFGGYGLTLEIPGMDRLLLGSCVRALQPDTTTTDPRIRRFAMDAEDVGTLTRLGAAPNRIGMSPLGADGTDATFEPIYKEIAAKLREYQAAKLPVTIEFGHSVPGAGKIQPLGRSRHHLAQKTKSGELRPYGSLDPAESDGKAYETRHYSDIAWSPEFDAVVKKNIKRLLKEFAWPKGPIVAVDLWNEPWNGASISGWMADDMRYREIFTAMAEAVEEVRSEDGAEVWLLSCDSSSNTFDKLFPDDDDRMLKWMDISSIHYQNTEPVSTVKAWLNRKHKNGPTRVWDTESWVANSDGRIASVIPSNYALGLERVVAIWSNWGRSVLTMVQTVKARAEGGEKTYHVTQAWPVASAVSAMQHFIGNRSFDRILWQGIPFVYRFNGHEKTPDGGCLVVVGDLESVFGYGRVPFMTVKCLDEVNAKKELHAKLAGLMPGSSERVAAETQWRQRAPLTGVTLILPDQKGRFRLHDYYGNIIPAKDGKLVVPVDDRGFYLATDGLKGSFDELTKAVENARIDGLMPVQVIAHDPTTSVAGGKAAVLLTMRNLLERPVKGRLQVKVGKLTVQAPAEVSLAPRDVKDISVALSGDADPANAYALSVSFDAGADGLALHNEVTRCNVIAKRKITVDGKLDEWQGVLPQTITTDGTVDRTDAEAAWWPDKPFNPTAKKGLATAWLAYDEKNFYFAARIADEKATKGMIRFDGRDDDASFWPETVIPLKYAKDKDGKEQVVGEGEPLTWPKGVRRYTYATWATLPFGDDSIQIGFNVKAEDDKPWYSYPKGTYRQFSGYWDTDYEYSLHKVMESKGGGTEIFRLACPGMPHKHFFDHSLKSKYEGAVKGELKITHAANVRIVECSIPWTEMPIVKERLDAGKTAKFSFRVNDDADVGCLELARDRSVSRLNAKAFKPDWVVHWANEVEFGRE